ncbi:hypothetical protein, variant [Aphanomyces invadans]|uniref:Amino acid transporter transmembrane domain-containing protein n=1 Tax=Aphanomyces invadans TaxID=157072 RepID=A0A024TK84_9STRA|nr:hypothetical protein, variant [Aphanomyces invadans]ETV94031.1 hypothetical protein, variant [Aphanomyces invadans]|eukprot:XP_008877233.1 hypothetical protein, variant [Aphanomyces invadans]
MATPEGERLLPTTARPSQGVYDALHQAKPYAVAVPATARQKTMCTCECTCACERGVPIITSIHLHTPTHQHSLSPSNALSPEDTSVSVPFAVVMTFMTLFMSVVGAGMLSIPFTFASAPISVVMMSLLAVGLGMGYTAELLVRVHIATNVSTFNGLAEVAFGSVVSKIVSATTIFAILGACVGCIEIVTDLSPFLVHFVGIETLYNPTVIVLPVFIVAVYPLTLLKNITALRFSSYVGFVASIYLVVAVTVRAASSTPAAIVDPPTYDDLPLKIAHVASVFNYAFVSHLNVIPLYANLRHAMQPSVQPSTALSALSLMRGVIYTMSIFCIVMYAVFGTHALTLYGSHIQGNILLNLENDRVMEFPRLAVLVTILFSFPLLFHPFMLLVESFALQCMGSEGVYVSRRVKAMQSLVRVVYRCRVV